MTDQSNRINVDAVDALILVLTLFFSSVIFTIGLRLITEGKISFILFYTLFCAINIIIILLAFNHLRRLKNA